MAKKSHPSHERDTKETALACVIHSSLRGVKNDQLLKQGWHHCKCPAGSQPAFLKQLLGINEILQASIPFTGDMLAHLPLNRVGDCNTGSKGGTR